MEQMTISPDSLATQAWKTAADYLDHAIEQVDVRFGEGFSRKRPELAAAMLQASALDLHAAMIAEALQNVVKALAERGSD